jgi:hypothetical protein
VRRILAVIPDEPTHKIAKTRWENWTKPFKARKFFIYMEKWMAITHMLNKAAPVQAPTPRLVQATTKLFLSLLGPFGVVRHCPACDSKPACHKRFKCRYNLPEYATLTRFFLLYLADKGELGDEPKLQLSYFKPLKRAKARKTNKNLTLIRKMVALTEWFVPESVFEQMKTLYSSCGSGRAIVTGGARMG